MNPRGSSLEVVQFNLALSALLFLSPNSAVLVFRRRVLNAGIKPLAAPIIELLERNKMKPRAKIALLVLLTLGGVMPISIYFTVPAAHGLVRFSSYSELERFLLTRSSCSYGYWNGYNKQLQLYGGPASFGPAVPGALSGNAAATTVSTAPSHSETNNQVAGVDELDTVKTDGRYIYTVSNNTVAIVDAYPATSAQLLSRISLVNQTIDGIFVEGDRLSVVSEAPRNPYSGSVYCGPLTMRASQLPLARCFCYSSVQIQNTSISVYDLTSRSSPTLKTTVTTHGAFVGARLIGDLVYLVATTPAQYNQTLPVTVVNGHAKETLATQIYHSDISDSAFSYTTVLALNATQDNPSPNVQTYLLGTSSTIYVSLTNIFLTQPVWDGQGETAIHRVSIDNSNISYEATGTVRGHVLNQFSMDEFQGYFRVATTGYAGWTGQTTSVYVLSNSLKIVGRLEGLGQGENFHSARFIGEMGYLVTFKKTDPLFVIELRDPTRPKVLGQLNTTGYSDYLQALDESHLIGIGKDTVDEGSFAWYQGIKVSLFDVSDPTKPSEVSRYIIGDRGSDSLGLRDGKSILLDAEKNLLVLPVTVSLSPNPSVPNAYGSQVWQGAYVFQITTNRLTFRGGITHIPDALPPFGLTSPLTITRELYIGGVLYTISSAMIGMNSLSDLQVVGSLSLL
jgi:uncharacterized secreted protein with C-terminal beta-propeller domain